MSEAIATPTETVEAFLKAFVAMDFDTALTHIAYYFDLLTAVKIHDPAAA